MEVAGGRRFGKKSQKVFKSAVSAVLASSVPILRYLKETVGIDINGQEGELLRTASVMAEGLDMVRFLVEEAGADLHASKEMSLRDAIRLDGSVDTVRYLLDRGADVGILDGEPLRLAVERGDAEVVRMILQRHPGERLLPGPEELGLAWRMRNAPLAALLSRHHLSCRPGVPVESKARPKPIHKGAIPRPQGTDI